MTPTAHRAPSPINTAALPAEAVGYLRAQDLPDLPMPDVLKDRLREAAPGCYADHLPVAPLYQLKRHVDACIARHGHGNLMDQAAFGIDGHGTGSWAFHYYLVSRRVAVLTQCRWGGAYDDPVVQRARLEGILGMTEFLMEQAEASPALQNNPGRALLVMMSDFHPSGWTWLGPDGAEGWQWDGDFSLLLAADALQRA
ncbi:hypothetical protein [Noviherbaspirillum galbum]|uniref:Uncharacterized protein n=1 Tax=Noviherbaspirillum galbum TaxID=2709383 RepID=A0A6B3SRH3_9BURK|nr:hypothetical protein [Noviherbaspirillum galbum]NEX61022.1 hypothetical protein [Noviherbaspirillum galbum]